MQICDKIEKERLASQTQLHIHVSRSRRLSHLAQPISKEPSIPKDQPDGRMTTPPHKLPVVPSGRAGFLYWVFRVKKIQHANINVCRFTKKNKNTNSA
jgi:hypothetical protein